MSPRPDRFTRMTPSGPSSLAELDRAGEGVRGLDRRDDALGPAHQPEGLHRLGVRDRLVLRPPDRRQVRVLRTDARVVEPGGDAVALDGLAVLVLHQVGLGALQHAFAAERDAGRVPTGLDAVTARFEAVQTDRLVVEERLEDAHRVRPATDARGDRVRQASDAVEHLLPRFFADHLVELADHLREGVRTGDGAQQVVRGLDVRHPVAEGVVDGVLQRAGTGLDRDDLGAEQAHPGDVERLALGVDGTHVHDAVHAEQGCGGRGGDTVLAGSGLGDQPGLAEAAGDERLPEHVVDLVRTGVVEVLALEDDPGTAGVLREPRHLGDDRGAAGVVAWRVSSSSRKDGSAHAVRNAVSSSSSARTSDSGTNRPPKSPK